MSMNDTQGLKHASLKQQATHSARARDIIISSQCITCCVSVNRTACGNIYVEFKTA